MERVSWAEWWRAAATPRNLGLLLVVLLGALAFIRLGSWQLDRAAIRGASEAERTAVERVASDPQPLDHVLEPGTTFLTDHQLKKVEVQGEWGEQVVVPGRSVEGEAAVLVVVQLRIADDGTHPSSSGNLWIPVLRGWIPAEQLDGAGLADAAAERAPAPTGPGSAVGYLSGSENSVTGEFPEGAVGAISTAQLANLWGGETYTGFLVLEAADHPSLETMPPPSYERERGMNLQNLFYAVEWFIFGGFALFVWWRWVRDDALRQKESALLAELDEGGADRS
nr:SURF1 family protein [Actinomycetales bacterium]